MSRARIALFIAALLGVVGQASHAEACAANAKGVLFISCAGETTARMHLNPMDTILDRPALPQTDDISLTVTGSYTSGERHEPEGMYILRGKFIDPNIQGWDGLAVIDRDGALTLHHVERVSLGGERWNLRRNIARRAFIYRAKAERWSALQSHLLIIDGTVDTKPIEGAARFHRRILFALPDGSYGIWQSVRALTLHDAALEIEQALAPRMALNLDMGSYDFCQLQTADSLNQCGTLLLEETGKISNFLVFSQSANAAKAN